MRSEHMIRIAGEKREETMRTRRRPEEMSDRELRSCRRALRLRRERRRKILVMSVAVAATLCMVVICAAFCGTIKANANNGYKYYTDIIVEPGDSLWTLAEEYVDYEHYRNINCYIKEVRNINHLSEDSGLTAGQILIVPYYSAEYVY